MTRPAVRKGKEGAAADGPLIFSSLLAGALRTRALLVLTADAVFPPQPGPGISLFSRQPPQQLPTVALGPGQAAACVLFD